jgi:hypothetical protein
MQPPLSILQLQKERQDEDYIICTELFAVMVGLTQITLDHIGSPCTELMKYNVSRLERVLKIMKKYLNTYQVILLSNMGTEELKIVRTFQKVGCLKVGESTNDIYQGESKME